MHRTISTLGAKSQQKRTSTCLCVSPDSTALQQMLTQQTLEHSDVSLHPSTSQSMYQSGIPGSEAVIRDPAPTARAKVSCPGGNGKKFPGESQLSDSNGKSQGILQ